MRRPTRSRAYARRCWPSATIRPAPACNFWPRPDSAIAKFLERGGPGLQQLAYTVRDVRASSDALRARGLRLLYDEPKRGTGGSLINFVHPKDAGGVLVELVQPA
jgi:methylmalonyl-CoA/ethylmalonyl-CoA epimerase